MLCIQEVLQPHLSDLTNLIATDACSAPFTWQLSALSLLQTILTIYTTPTLPTTPSTDSDSIRVASHKTEQAYLCILSTLSQGGYLSRLFSTGIALKPNSILPTSMFTPTIPPSIQTTTTTNSSVYDSNSSNIQSQQGLLECILSLCISLSHHKQGSDELIKLDILSYILDMDYLSSPPSALQGMEARLGAGTGVRSGTGTGSGIDKGKHIHTVEVPVVVYDVHHQHFESRLQSVLNILQALLSKYSTRNIIEKCLLIIKKSHYTILHYLRIRVPTLKGIILTQSIIRVLSLCARLPVYIPSSTYTTTSTSSRMNKSGVESREIGTDGVRLFEGVLGQEYADIYTVDIIKLMHNIAISTKISINTTLYDNIDIPILHNTIHDSIFDNHKNGHNSDWWSKIRPVTGTEDEKLLSIRLNRPSKAYLSYSNSTYWTLFDDIKYNTALDILCDSSVYIQARVTAASKNQRLDIVPRKIPKYDNNTSINTTLYIPNIYTSTAVSLLSVDFTAVASTYISVVSTLLKRRTQVEGEDKVHKLGVLGQSEKSINRYWLRTENIIGDLDTTTTNTTNNSDIDTYQIIAENLLSVLYILITISILSNDDDNHHRQIKLLSNDICRILEVNDKFPTHSFLGQVSIWIKEKLEYN